MTELDDLLSRLPQPQETITITGFAVGKSDGYVHLAVRTGIIGVPLDEITDLRRVDAPGTTSEVVEVDVKDPAMITQLRRVQLFPRGGEGVSLAADSGHTTWTIPIHSETATLTGDPLERDMTDDGIHGSEGDDSHIVEAEEIWF
ncbi:hypothetical protein [Microlunatus parietis]|uniref:Uncharacterized protein n=1 Tax=Microlunatus parietis TaxID=682979 RepID=A0A7Y9I696_9ACTN|nr:hypothetical protein [Microlunatus parietis]NYE70913.1 hypothetical protein [Microlunatus parietis]